MEKTKSDAATESGEKISAQPRTEEFVVSAFGNNDYKFRVIYYLRDTPEKEFDKKPDQEV